MPSHALLNWQTFGLIRLVEIEQQCSTSAITGPSGLAEENLRGGLIPLVRPFPFANSFSDLELRRSGLEHAASDWHERGS